MYITMAVDSIQQTLTALGSLHKLLGYELLPVGDEESSLLKSLRNLQVLERKRDERIALPTEAVFDFFARSESVQDGWRSETNSS